MTEFEAISGVKKIKAASLFVPILLVSLILRVVVVLLSGYELSEVLLVRAIISDIFIAAAVALLISLIPFRFLQFSLGILVCILGSANVEHILANGANMDVAFSKYLANTTFLSGSVLTLNLVLLAAITIGVFCCGVLYLEKIQEGPVPTFLKARALALSIGILSAISIVPLLLMPVTLVNASWTQTNFLEENIKAYIGENNSEQSPIADSSKIEKLLYYQDLSGQTILSESRKKNVVLILIEGISQVHLAQGLMPWLEETRHNQFQLSKYIANQRQTNRGLYSVLCGRYPNFIDKSAKADIVNSYGAQDPCLPQLLNESGYRTVFMQSAGLSFMRKDLFASAAGFSEYFGDSNYESAHGRTDWGVDDLTLYENARKKMSELRSQDSPWFLTLLTSGTHHPFNNPDGPNTQEGTIKYADKAIAKLIEWAIADDLLKDTLFIISSDEASTSDSLDLNNLISSNWAPLVVVDDQIGARANKSVFSHVDIPISVLDYLSIPVPTHLYGRSIFRNYETPRTVYFANVYTGLMFSLTGDSEIIACNRSIQCSRYASGGDFFRYPVSDLTEVALDPGDVELIRDVVYHSDQRYADFGSRPIFSLSDKEFSDQDSYVLLSQFKVPMKKGSILSFEIDIANNLGGPSGKLMTELIYHECPGPIASNKQQLFIDRGTVANIRELQIIAEEDMSICTFLIVHSQNRSKWGLQSLEVKLSG